MSNMPKSLYRYIFERSYRQQIVVIGLTIALLPLAPIPLELQRRMLDDAVANGDSALLLKLGGFYLAAMLLSAGLKFAMRAQRELISAHIVRKLRKSVFLGIYTNAPDHAEADENEVNEGAVVSMMGSEVEKLGGFAGSAISGPLFELGTLAVVLGYMFWVEPLVAMIAVGLYSPQLVIVPYFQARMNRLAQVKALKMRTLGTMIVDTPEDDLLRSEPPKRFTEIVEAILKLRRRFILTKNTMKTINNLLIALGPFGVIFYGGHLVIQGEIEVGVILAFVSGLERLGSPLRELVGSYSQITDARMRYATLLAGFPKDFDDSQDGAPIGVPKAAPKLP